MGGQQLVPQEVLVQTLGQFLRWEEPEKTQVYAAEQVGKCALLRIYSLALSAVIRWLQEVVPQRGEQL